MGENMETVNKESTVKTSEKTTTKVAARTIPFKREIYSVDDFCKASITVFGVMPECVKAAFFVAKKESATEEEALKIVSDFMKKEVR